MIYITSSQIVHGKMSVQSIPMNVDVLGYILYLMAII